MWRVCRNHERQPMVEGPGLIREIKYPAKEHALVTLTRLLVEAAYAFSMHKEEQSACH